MGGRRDSAQWGLSVGRHFWSLLHTSVTRGAEMKVHVGVCARWGPGAHSPAAQRPLAPPDTRHRRAAEPQRDRTGKAGRPRADQRPDPSHVSRVIMSHTAHPA